MIILLVLTHVGFLPAEPVPVVMMVRLQPLYKTRHSRGPRNYAYHRSGISDLPVASSCVVYLDISFAQWYTSFV